VEFGGFDVLGGLRVELEVERLQQDVASPFDLDRLQIRRSPIRVASIDLARQLWPHRINQCLVKRRGSDAIELGPFDSPALAAHIDACIAVADTLSLDWQSRYLYVTVDTEPVLRGATQRVPGWHFDDLQGEDIVEKQPGGFLFVATSCLPTEFALQPFRTDGLDPARHNVFRWCDRQVRANAVVALWPQALALLSAYDVHRGVAATEPMPRVFVRLLFTHCALTSGKTTVNPGIDYDHAPHTTNGQIPAHLV
jgi:hypothetical protein